MSWMSWKVLEEPQSSGSWEQRAGSWDLQHSWASAPHSALSPWGAEPDPASFLPPKVIFLEAGTCYILAQQGCIFSQWKLSNTRKANISEIGNSRPVRRGPFFSLDSISTSVSMLLLGWFSSLKMEIITKKPARNVLCLCIKKYLLGDIIIIKKSYNR